MHIKKITILSMARQRQIQMERLRRKEKWKLDSHEIDLIFFKQKITSPSTVLSTALIKQIENSCFIRLPPSPGI